MRGMTQKVFLVRSDKLEEVNELLAKGASIVKICPVAIPTEYNGFDAQGVYAYIVIEGDVLTMGR
ncbi:MAG: hypothetical protein IJZ55_10910 [Lachnospiraceae bacterium]|nr:hypothetical protein [Lachnospiraceae bacterium]